jgi:DNA-3-methyladenine glycosylase II
MRRIKTKIDLKEGVAALIRSCGHMARVHAFAGDRSLRRRPAKFRGLTRIIVGQQLSIASANAIWGRLEAQLRPFSPEALISLPEGDLRRARLSVAKIATLRRLATAINRSSLDLDALTQAPEEVFHAKLTALKGIGPWTTDIYILFCLVRADAWSPGDLALQVAVKDMLALEARPNQALMIEIAEVWRPWRAVAARMLWSYYALRRKPVDVPA